MSRALALAMRTLGREWRSGELGVLLLALTIAVAALTGVGFLVGRIGAAVDMQASEVLAADVRLGSPQPISTRYFDEAARRGVRASRGINLLSVVFNGDEGQQLTNLRAVSDGFPLRGKVLVADEPFVPGVEATGIPARGEVWPDSKLLVSINAKVGSKISIGSATFTVGRVLISRPDQGGGFADLAPSLLMNIEDVPSTELIQPGSRVSYVALFAGARDRIDDFKEWLRTSRARGERLVDVEQASTQIKSAVDRASRFLSLASLVSVLLCAIAVAMSARRYVQRHLDAVALLKTLGATRAFTLSVSVLQLMVIAVVATLLGSALGFLAQEWLLRAIRGLLNAELPPADLKPLAVGFVTAVAVLAGFALPPLLQLSRVPTIRVLRRDVGPPPPLVMLAFGPAVFAVAFLIYWVVRDWFLFVVFTLGLVGFLALLAGAGFVLVTLAGRLRGSVGVSWRYGVANLSRRRAESLVQIVAFGMGIMVLLLLGLVRNDLANDWRMSLPKDIPNFFFINIPQDERDSFMADLTTRGAQPSRVMPMIRGRLVGINGTPSDRLRFRREDGEEFAGREQNLTWADQLGPDNRIVAGEWWSPATKGQKLVSIATEFQESMGLRLGDTLTFDIAGETVEATIASFRKVKWDSFQPNFFIVFAPGVIDNTAGTYMTSVHFPSVEAKALASLARKYPSVSIFDIQDLLDRVRSVIDKAVLAVQSVFLFTLFAGLTVMMAAVQASRDERRYESAMLRTLGASRGTVLQGVLAEFITLGALSGLLASLGAVLAGYFVATRVLEMKYTFEPLVWIVGMLGGALLVSFSGWLATRSVINTPPVATLRAG